MRDRAKKGRRPTPPLLPYCDGVNDEEDLRSWQAQNVAGDSGKVSPSFELEAQNVTPKRGKQTSWL